MQENILEKHPDADLRVYVAWLPTLPTDARFSVADLMVDDRVRHFWDGDQLLGSYFARLIGAPGAVAWDVFFLYPPDASWGDRPRVAGAPRCRRRRETGASDRAVRQGWLAQPRPASDHTGLTPLRVTSTLTTCPEEGSVSGRPSTRRSTFHGAPSRNQIRLRLNRSEPPLASSPW